MNHSILLTYLAQVRRTRRICAFLRIPYRHLSPVLTMLLSSLIKTTTAPMELCKDAAIAGIVQDVASNAPNMNTVELLKAVGR